MVWDFAARATSSYRHIYKLDWFEPLSFQTFWDYLIKMSLVCTTKTDKTPYSIKNTLKKPQSVETFTFRKFHLPKTKSPQALRRDSFWKHLRNKARDALTTSGCASCSVRNSVFLIDMIFVTDERSD